MPFVQNLSWSNINSLRNYPLRDGLSRIDTFNIFTIPNDFIIDFSLAATSTISTQFYISEISNQIDEIVIQISDNNSNIVGTFTISIEGFIPNSDFYLQTTTGTYAFANGKITIGSISSIILQPAGIFTFTQSSTEFEPRTVIASTAAINEITFTDSQGTSQSLTGIVNIVARNNLRYSYDSGDNYLILDAGDGLGLNTICTTPTCVQFINGVAPDSNGNISFVGVGCTEISSTASATLEIVDSCCSPCAGCLDLETLTSRVNNLESSFMNLRNQYQYLTVELSSFISTVSYSCTCVS